VQDAELDRAQRALAGGWGRAPREIELAHCSGATAMGDLVAKARLGREMVQIISFKIFLDIVKELKWRGRVFVECGYWILDLG
jgi:hypothetical protein